VQSGTLLVNSVPVGVAHVVSLAAMTNLLRTRQSAATPYLGAGFEETWQQDRGVLDRFPPRTDGLVARILHKDGPADRGGLREGDLVTAVDGRKVDRVAQLLRAVRAKRPGETVELSVTMPDGAGTRQVSVQLGRLEAGWPESDKND
jgi:serine protease Do